MRIYEETKDKLIIKKVANYRWAVILLLTIVGGGLALIISSLNSGNKK